MHATLIVAVCHQLNYITIHFHNSTEWPEGRPGQPNIEPFQLFYDLQI